MGKIPEEEVAEEVEEVLTAGQALVLVAIIVAIALSYAYRFWKQMEAARSEESFLEYDFQLPAEKEQFMQILAQKPEEKPENRQKLQQWHHALCQVLFHRVLKVIDLHEKVQNDYRTQSNLYKRGVAVYMLPQIERAKALVEQEVQECGMFANKLQPNWGQKIFPEAYKIREEIKKKEAEEKAKREAEEELKEREEIERLIKEEEEEEKKRKSEQAAKELLESEDKKKETKKKR